MSPERADGVTALLGKSSEFQGLSTMGGLEPPQLRAKPSGDGRAGGWCLKWEQVSVHEPRREPIGSCRSYLLCLPQLSTFLIVSEACLEIVKRISNICPSVIKCFYRQRKQQLGAVGASRLVFLLV